MESMLRLTLLTFALMLLGGCAAAPGAAPASWPGLPSSAPDPHALIENPATAAERIVNRAKEEVRRGVVYDASYRSLEYPGGDVPQDRGACTEVVTRALREAGYDLQKLMH